MKKITLFLLTICVGINVYAQDKFQKGYFVDNNGKKVLALIQNENWETNPESFNYKFFDNGKLTTLTLKDAREFAIDNFSKYKRLEITIDNASDNVNDLSIDKTPQYTTKTVFLKIAVESDELSLFEYKTKNQLRFFYQKGTQKVTLLRYNQYKKSNGDVGENNEFREQLKKNVAACVSVSDELPYTKVKLGDLIIASNNCNRSDKKQIDFREYESHKDWAFKFKLGVGQSSIDITNRTGVTGQVERTSVRIGFELEHFLKFKNKNWSVFLEPTYNSISDDLIGINYNSVEVPVGIRYYIKISPKSSVFLNGGVSVDFAGSSTIGNNPLSSGVAGFYGAGYRFLKQFSLEVRNYTNRRLNPTDTNILEVNQSNFAVILGYVF
jgi:hypothetical protein